jgi:hypothetical protein
MGPATPSLQRWIVPEWWDGINFLEDCENKILLLSQIRYPINQKSPRATNNRYRVPGVPGNVALSLNQKAPQRFVNKPKKQKPNKKDAKKSGKDGEEEEEDVEKKTILKDGDEKENEKPDNRWEARSRKERFKFNIPFPSPKSDETQKDGAADDVKPKSEEVDVKLEPEVEGDKQNGTSEGDGEKQCDKTDAPTAIEVLSANAVTQEQQQNNKNGKSNNNNINKKNKKNAKGKLDSQACDEVGDVEA